MVSLSGQVNDAGTNLRVQWGRLPHDATCSKNKLASTATDIKNAKSIFGVVAPGQRQWPTPVWNFHCLPLFYVKPDGMRTLWH
jgi:hypothetical protein